MFERFKSKKDFPPQQDDSRDEGAYERALKPEPLNVDGLVDKAKEGNTADVAENVVAYINGWKEYATDNNIFFSKDIGAMGKAEAEIVRLAEEVAKIRGAYDSSLPAQLRTKLEELTGTLAQNVENAVTDNEKRIAGFKEATPAENKNELESNIEELSRITEPVASEAPAPLIETVEEIPAGFPQPPEKKAASERPKKNYSEAAIAAEVFSAEKKQEMLAAEAAYLAAYKEFYAQKGAKEKNEPDDLIELKVAYDKSRLGYGNALSSFAIERLGRQTSSGEDMEKKLRVLERYDRIVRYNEVIKPTAEKMYQTRLEAMGERAPGIFSKGLSWAASQNKKLEDKLGKNGARFAKAAATTIVVAGGAAAVGAFGTAGLLGALGWGTFRFGRALASSFAGAGVGEFAAVTYEKMVGKKQVEWASEMLQHAGRDIKDFSLESLDDIDFERMALEKEVDPATLERRKMIVRAVTAAGVGAGMSGFLSLLPSADAAPVELIEKTGTVPPIVKPSIPEADAPLLSEPTSTVTVETPEPVAPPQEIPIKSAPLAAPAPEAPPAAPIQSGASTPEIAPDSKVAAALTAEYVSPIKNVVQLPEGVDPNSPEATAFLNRAYNPQVFAEAPQAAPAAPLPVESVPEAPIAPAPAAEAAPVLETPESGPVAAPIEAAPSAPAPVESVPAAPVEAAPEADSSGPTNLIEQPTGSGFEKGVTLESLEPDLYVNKFGVDVLPKEPHVYELETPKNMRVLWGGTTEQQVKIIEEYLQESADQQRVGVPINVFFPDAEGKQILISYALDKDGNTVRTAATNGLLRRPVEFTGIDSFKAKID